MGIPIIDSANRENGKVIVRYPKVLGAVSYEIYRSTTVNGTYQHLGSTTEETYQDATAGMGTYFYKISAKNKECNTYGSSALSKAVQTGVEITGTKSMPDGLVRIQYEQSKSGTGYYIFRRPSGSTNYSLIGTVNKLDQGSFTDTTALPGIRYEYAVAVYTVYGGVTYNSAIGQVKYGVNMGIPIIDSANRENGKIIVKYPKVLGAISYEIYRSTTVNGVYQFLGSTAEETYQDTTAENGTYYYKISAINKECNN